MKAGLLTINSKAIQPILIKLVSAYACLFFLTNILRIIDSNRN